MIKQFVRSRLAIRIFLITTVLITLTALTIHSLFSLFLPGFYYQYKEKQMTQQVNMLTVTLDQLPFEQAIKVVDNFANETGMQIILTDESGKVIYVPNLISQYEFAQDFFSKLYVPHQDLMSTNDYLVAQYEFSPTNITTNIQLIVRVPLQPIDEASKAINSFLPYLLLIILFVASVAGFIFTRMIAKPLLRLNKAASKMAILDFSADLPIEADDEIGEIARNLEQLAHNLERTMGELQTANQQLQDDIEKERLLELQRREFIAVVSHELKTPLTAILGRLEGMIYNIGAFSDRDKYLQQTYDVAKQMEQLVYEIVSVSKLESEAFQPKRDVINLTKILHSCINENSYLAQEKNQQLHVEITDDLVIIGDEQLLRKVIINLLRNAIYYSPNEAEISLVTKHASTQIQISVTNTGVELTPQQLVYVLEPFHRLEQSRNRQTGGSGLGLYIVTQIAKRCHFDFQLISENKYVQAIVTLENGQNKKEYQK